MSPVLHCYVHIPFCHHICPYCAFYKHKPGKLANHAFVEAILSQFAAEKPVLAEKLDTLYFGGGTPSLLSSTHIEKLLLGFQPFISEKTEVTFEANPATFTLDKARLMRSLGINRISLGIQSFQTPILKTLGRDHSGEDGIKAFQTLREAGFENISIDLMFSIPGQDSSLWEKDLEIATCQLNPEHVSCYNLTYEEDTEFLKRHETGELDANEDRDADLFYAAKDHLEAAGFHHYEISNYGKPGQKSRHNRAYWNGNDYLGLGPGAIGTVHGERSKTLPDTARFVENPLLKVEEEILTEEDRRIEAIAMQLRTSEGIAISRLDPVESPTQQGLVGEDFRLNRVESLTQQGLVEKRGDRLFLTRSGLALADPIAAQLI